MDPLKTLCSAGPTSANSYSERFAIVSDKYGEMIAIFACPNAVAMAEALVALPEVLTAMDGVDAALAALSGPAPVNS